MPESHLLLYCLWWEGLREGDKDVHMKTEDKELALSFWFHFGNYLKVRKQLGTILSNQRVGVNIVGKLVLIIDLSHPVLF